MFHLYSNGAKVITATERAYEVLYRGQGFVPVPPAAGTGQRANTGGDTEGNKTDADSETGQEAGTDGSTGGGEPDTGKVKTPKRNRKSA